MLSDFVQKIEKFVTFGTTASDAISDMHICFFCSAVRYFDCKQLICNIKYTKKREKTHENIQ